MEATFIEELQSIMRLQDARKEYNKILDEGNVH